MQSSGDDNAFLLHCKSFNSQRQTFRQQTKKAKIKIKLYLFNALLDSPIIFSPLTRLCASHQSLCFLCIISTSQRVTPVVAKKLAHVLVSVLDPYAHI
ncbi:hypothetical protein CROQUDRAFT_659719 [Cronartium quercuum f. sp. fusiforme G11]|uniref:Uncharacterized protein n=1 Tax=Cronartium quercuum f. sp. fusiforme G11 TaxID=708437 RepID=A0A9P6TAI4_9BASI|nr:hypothetical protein CROQUDRAFT_659719 [Cronartium quercuum f. sp. fusiforme G11]